MLIILIITIYSQIKVIKGRVKLSWLYYVLTNFNFKIIFRLFYESMLDFKERFCEEESSVIKLDLFLTDFKNGGSQFDC